jgi:hypothetical protein
MVPAFAQAQATAACSSMGEKLERQTRKVGFCDRGRNATSIQSSKAERVEGQRETLAHTSHLDQPHDASEATLCSVPINPAVFFENINNLKLPIGPLFTFFFLFLFFL